jgi:phenylpropionate dioxygenase-like ring-hydroxylating dioxygenase large terminal subunit
MISDQLCYNGKAPIAQHSNQVETAGIYGLLWICSRELSDAQFAIPLEDGDSRIISLYRTILPSADYSLPG